MQKSLSLHQLLLTWRIIGSLIITSDYTAPVTLPFNSASAIAAQTHFADYTFDHQFCPIAQAMRL